MHRCFVCTSYSEHAINRSISEFSTVSTRSLSSTYGRNTDGSDNVRHTKPQNTASTGSICNIEPRRTWSAGSILSTEPRKLVEHSQNELYRTPNIASTRRTSGMFTFPIILAGSIRASILGDSIFTPWRTGALPWHALTCLDWYQTTRFSVENSALRP